jgi:hypothetical protein
MKTIFTINNMQKWEKTREERTIQIKKYIKIFFEKKRVRVLVAMCK